jgi:2,4-dienoyl-CoA reductase-like NADH-dependent reductase (Old Yellow Enzyme family)
MTPDIPFPHLFSPLAVGGAILPNRIVSSGHDTVMVRDGRVTDQLVAYHRARAEGGAGLIIVQVAGVHETARYTSHVLMATDDACIEGYRRLAAAVAPHGTVLFGQLFHPGREVMESQDGSLPVAVAPSSVPNERFHVMPRALAIDEIDEIVAGYVAGARRLREAGLDGVEIVASHGYLPSQFLNPSVNLRDDRYGGSEENRLRFLRDVLAGVREGTDPGTVVGLRISIDEQDPSGLPSDVALDACRALTAQGLVDYLNVTTGTSASLAGSDHIVPEMSMANAYTGPLAQRVRDVVGVPVLVGGRVNQPQEAERLLADGVADAVVMTRALICDPDLPSRARAGALDDIRACIGCNQACIGHFHAGYPISCIQHPETGREIEFGRRRPTGRRRRVLVAGAGPAGLKAAAVAAECGHSVDLHEAGRRLGGQVLLAQQLPDRAEFGGVVTNLTREATRAGCRIETGSAVDLDVVDRLDPDLVVVATGARPYLPPLEVMGSPCVLDAWEVIDGSSPPRGHVVVADWRSDWIGPGVARLLAARGMRVTLAVNAPAPGSMLQQYVRDALVRALVREGIEVLPWVRPVGIFDDSIYLQHVLTGEPVVLDGTSGLVLACGHEPEATLLGTLRATGRAVVGVGDALAPRTVEEAVLDGLRAGAGVDGLARH